MKHIEYVTDSHISPFFTGFLGFPPSHNKKDVVPFSSLCTIEWAKFHS